jgi:cytochrome c biogenesis protein CcdA
MDELPLAFAFTAGLFAVFNPCGFALLPAYLGRFVLAARPAVPAMLIGRALVVGLAVSSGFAAVFAVIGVVVRGLGVDVLSRSPWVSIAIGVALVVYGVLTVLGAAPKLTVPRLDGDRRVASSMMLYGAAYAVVSLGCTLPTFLAYVAGTMTTRDVASGLAVYAAYVAGFTVLLVALSISVAFAATGLASNARRLVPVVERLSGVLLVVAGGYVAYYGWYELTRLGEPDPIIDLVTGWSAALQEWLDRVRPLRIGAVLAAMVVATAGLLVVRRRRVGPHRVRAHPDGRSDGDENGPSHEHADPGPGETVADEVAWTPRQSSG